MGLQQERMTKNDLLLEKARSKSNERGSWDRVRVSFVSRLETYHPGPARISELSPIGAERPVLYATTKDVKNPQPVISVAARFSDDWDPEGFEEDAKSLVIQNPETGELITLLHVSDSTLGRSYLDNLKDEQVQFLELIEKPDQEPTFSPYNLPD